MDTPTYLSLYSGGGGLDLGFKLAVPGARAVGYVERDAAAIALLVDHMQTGQLDDAPLWSDSGTFDGAEWRGKVDWIIGGFPCQPWSVAGRQAGLDDERWLWPHIREILGDVQPRGAFFENVPGLLRGGLGPILGDLAALGFDAEWITVRASDVGAPHRRERVFILGDTDRQGLQGRQQPVEQRAYELPAWPPGPSDTDAWAAILTERPDLAPAVGKSAEQGLPKRNRERVSAAGTRDAEFECASGRNGQTSPEPEVRGVDDGLARGMDLSRTDKLRILGNGVVPQQAALAFHILKERITNGSASTSK